MTEAKYKTPHVHTAIANILKSLSVEKGGTLPSNMGGKGYITAHDTSAEVKRQFVDNDLIFIPNETVIKHENISGGDRSLKIAILITGSYTIISTVDGSSETVSGTGDGLASGTAVASNIASTNALKNALLRTFLITEQSVEDAAKDGPAESKTNPALANAKKTTTTAAKNVAQRVASKNGKSYDTIMGEFVNPKKVEMETIHSLVSQLKLKDKTLSGEPLYDAVLAELEKGVGQEK